MYSNAELAFRSVIHIPIGYCRDVRVWKHLSGTNEILAAPYRVDKVNAAIQNALKSRFK